jgi:hypothetical protein
MNGLALCELCRHKVATDAELIPMWFRNLSRWSRPARPNGSLGSRGQWLIRRGESEGNRVGRALDEAGNALVGWARQLQDDRGVLTPEDADDEASTVRLLCEHLGEHLTSIATTDWAGDFARGMAQLEADLQRMAGEVTPGWYAGECKRCTYPTYVMPGLTWLTCGGCGATTYARDHLEQVLTEARGWVARPMRLAEATVALLDTEQSIARLHKRISKWGERGIIDSLRLLDADGDPVGPKRFRLGDVLDRLAAEGSTRLDGDGAGERIGA